MDNYLCATLAAMHSKIRHILLFASLFLTTVVCANSKIDSLRNLLQAPDVHAADSVILLSELGYEYWTVNPRQSVVYGRKALELAVKLDFTEREAFSYRVIGVAYWALGDYPVALQNMLKALEIYESLDHRYGMGSMQMNIGLVYSDQGAIIEAKKFFRKGLSIFTELGETRSIATTHTKMASVLMLQDSLGLAKEYLHKAIELHRSIGFNYGLAEAYNRLGIVYRYSGDLDASLDYLHRSRDRSISIDDFEGLAKCYSDLGFTYLERKEYSEALENFEKSEALATDIGSKKWELEALRGIAKTQEKRSDLKMALANFKRYQALRDTLQNEQKIMAIANLQEEYESRQQLEKLRAFNEQVITLEREAEVKNWLLFLMAIGALLTFIVIVLGIRNYRLQAARQQTDIENSELKHKELERDLELSRRELTSYALNFLQKNEFMSELKSDLNQLKPTAEVVRIRQKLIQSRTLDKDWEKFKMQFDKVHGRFTSELKEKHPDLSPTELKHCALIRINLNIKEYASILGISPESAKTSRYRIRKKMKIHTEKSLFDYLIEFGQ